MSGKWYRCPKCGRREWIDVKASAVWCQRIMCQPRPGQYREMKAESSRRAA